ncbi:MAG: hypothetical protein AAGI34_04665 [Pseudomonadota bacterium]
MQRRRTPVALAVDEGRADARVAWGGALVNYYAQVAPAAAKAPTWLKPTPGTRVFADLDDTKLLGLTQFNGAVIAATRRGLFRIEAGGTSEQIGDDAFRGPVRFASNGTTLVLTDGARIFKYEADASGALVVSELAGPDIQPSPTVAFFQGYFVFPDGASPTGRWYYSDLYSTEVDGLNFATAEQVPDPLLAIVPNGDFLFLFGTDSTEVWYNVGGAGVPFARQQGARSDIGIASSYCAAKLTDTLVWLGNDGIVYAARGLQPQRISTPTIEDAIARQRLGSATAFAHQIAGHEFYQLTLESADPDDTDGARTWVFDLMTGLWHQRSTLGIGRHIADGFVDAFGKRLVGDATSGRVLEWVDDLGDDVGKPIAREVYVQPLHRNRIDLRFDALEFEIDPAGLFVEPQQDNDAAPTPLLPPINLSATDANIVRLAWADVNGGTNQEIGHAVYRSTSPFEETGLPQPLGVTGQDIVTFIDQTAVPDVTYYYRVSALRGQEEAVSSLIVFTPSGGYGFRYGLTYGTRT